MPSFYGFFFQQSLQLGYPTDGPSHSSKASQESASYPQSPLQAFLCHYHCLPARRCGPWTDPCVCPMLSWSSSSSLPLSPFHDCPSCL